MHELSSLACVYAWVVYTRRLAGYAICDCWPTFSTHASDRALEPGIATNSSIKLHCNTGKANVYFQQERQVSLSAIKLAVERVLNGF